MNALFEVDGIPSPSREQGEAFVAPVSQALAQEWCRRWHYTGTLGNANIARLGLYRGVSLHAVVAVGCGGNRFGVADKFGLTTWPGDVEITRVVVHPDAPRNTASRALGLVQRWLARAGYAWAFSYSDTREGHHGGIYQAVNAVYVGTTARQWANFELDGKPLSKRAVGGRFGTTRWPEVREVAAREGCVVSRAPWFPKLTYILVLPGAAKRRVLAALGPYCLPYPKRDGRLGKDATPYRNHRPFTEDEPDEVYEDQLALGGF